MMLESFIQETEGTLVSADGVPSNAGQSVQLIAQWCKYLGLPHQWTHPVFWWDEDDHTFAEHWDKVINDGRDKVPSPGDIVIFGGNLPGSEGDGHGSIFLRLTSEDSWEGLDCNWGGRTAHKQSHSWAYVLGWFTPKNKAVLEAPIPTPIADESTYGPYVAQVIEPKLAVIKRDQTPLYNLNDVSYESFHQNAVSHMPANYEVSITAIAHHRLGGTYYLPDSGRAEGFKVEDCREYDSDETEERVTEVTVAAPPSKVLPYITSPLVSPKMDDMILITKRIPHYNSVSGAKTGTNPVGYVTPSNYYVFKRMSNGMLQITSQPGVPSGRWINPADLIEKPPYNPADHFERWISAKTLYLQEHGEVIDIRGQKRPMSVRRGQSFKIVGETVGEDGIRYAIPDSAFVKGEWYGIISDNLDKTNPLDQPKPAPVPIQPAAPVLPPVQPFIAPQPSIGVKMITKARAFIQLYKT